MSQFAVNVKEDTDYLLGEFFMDQSGFFRVHPRA
jgi:hypothetical protein